METSIKLIASDMGGVLAVHSDHDLESRLLADFGLGGYRHFSDLDSRLGDLLVEHSKGAIDEATLWGEFASIANITIAPYEGSLWGKYFRPELDEAVLTLYEEIKGRGKRLVCATNTEPAHLAYHRTWGHYAIFDAVYASCEIARVKPDRSYFEYILDKEGVEAHTVLFIDDLQENCESAAELGMHAFLYSDVAELRWYLVDMDII